MCKIRNNYCNYKDFYKLLFIEHIFSTSISWNIFYYIVSFNIFVLCIFASLHNGVYYFQIEDMLTKLKETNNTVYNFVDYHNLSSLQAIYFTYWWCRFGCEKITQAKGGKKILQVVKHKKFDVIVQDVVAHQCLYGLWEVNTYNKMHIIKFLIICICIYRRL